MAEKNTDGDAAAPPSLDFRGKENYTLNIGKKKEDEI